MTRKHTEFKYCSYNYLGCPKNSVHRLWLVAKLQFNFNFQSLIPSYSLFWFLNKVSEVTSTMCSPSWVIFPKDMTHFSIICRVWKKVKYYYFVGIWKWMSKKKRWDVDHCESFLGKKGRTNTGCCLAAVKAKDLVLTQAAAIDGCRTQRRSCSRVTEETFPL